MKLTIGIPVYNNVETLKVAIDSIISQNNQEIEYRIIISEDYSTDEIHNEVLKLLAEYQNQEVEYHFNKPALGMCGNWNHCIKLADTKYVALLHDDDFLYPDYFDEILKVIKSRLKFDVLFFDTDVFIDGNKVPNNVAGLKKFYLNLKIDKIKKYKPGDYFFGSLDAKTLPTCGTLYNRAVFEEYDEKYGYSVDEIYAEELCTRKNIYFYNKIVAVHTFRNNTNLSSTKKVKQNFVLEKEKHRLSMGDKSWIFKFCNLHLRDGMKVDYVYPWHEYLFPEFNITKRVLLERKVFGIIKRMYIYMQVFSYKKLKR